MRPPRPAYTPSPNGNLYTRDMTAGNQRSRPISNKWQSHLQDMLTPSSSRAYAMGCAIITLLLLTVFLIFYFLGEISHSCQAIRYFDFYKPNNKNFALCNPKWTHCACVSVSPPVQQGSVVQRLTEALKENEVAATELSLLIQELQALRHNLTALRGREWGQCAQKANTHTQMERTVFYTAF